jgi:hypothetical protein
VKSTLLVRSSRPTKNSEKVGASKDRVAKRRPLGVRWLLIWMVCWPSVGRMCTRRSDIPHLQQIR